MEKLLIMGGGVHFPCKSFPNNPIDHDGGRLVSRNVFPGIDFDALLPVPSGFKRNSSYPTEACHSSYSNPTENAFDLEFVHGTPFLTDVRRWGLQQPVAWTRPSNFVEILPTLKLSRGTSLEDSNDFDEAVSSQTSDDSSIDSFTRAFQGQRRQTVFDRWQHEKLEKAFLSCHYPDQSTRQQLSLDLHVDGTRIQIWFQNRRAKWRKMDNTRKCPGRPSLKRPPTNCSGIPISTEEIERRNKCTRTGRAKRKCRVTSSSPDSTSGGGGACRLPHATERKDQTETQSSVSTQEFHGKMVDLPLMKPNQDVFHHDFCYSDNGRRCYRSIDSTGDGAQFSEVLKVTTNESNSLDRALCQTKDRSSVATYASKSLLPANRNVKQPKLTFSIDSILGRTL